MKKEEVNCVFCGKVFVRTAQQTNKRYCKDICKRKKKREDDENPTEEMIMLRQVNGYRWKIMNYHERIKDRRYNALVKRADKAAYEKNKQF